MKCIGFLGCLLSVYVVTVGQLCPSHICVDELALQRFKFFLKALIYSIG